MNIRNGIIKTRFVCRLSKFIHTVCNYSPKAFDYWRRRVRRQPIPDWSLAGEIAVVFGAKNGGNQSKIGARLAG